MCLFFLFVFFWVNSHIEIWSGFVLTTKKGTLILMYCPQLG